MLHIYHKRCMNHLAKSFISCVAPSRRNSSSHTGFTVLIAKAPTVETQPFADPAFTWLKLVFVSANKPATVLRIDDEQLGLGLRKALLESDGHAEGIRQ